ncbi:MAG: antibiotic biosynthesis monooxygenase [Anaerolineales bacterium]
MYGLQGKIIAIEGQRDALAKILLQAAEALQQNPECIHYLVSNLPEERDALWVSEVWTTKEAHDKSLEPDDIRALIAQARPILEKFDEQIVLEALGGKGLP